MSRKSRYDHLRADAIRLRDELRMGTRAIQRKLGVPIATLHYWLKEHPLTADEQKKLIQNAKRYVAPKKKIHEGRGFPCDVIKNPSTIELGAIGEAAILYRFCLMGFKTATAFTDGDVVDLYVRDRNDGQRVAFVQVRMASRSGPNGLPKISLRRNSNGRSKRFKPGDMHFLVGFCMENQSAYVYSSDEAAHLRNSIAVTPEAHEAWHKLRKWFGEHKERAPDIARAEAPVRTARRRKSPTKTRRSFRRPA